MGIFLICFGFSELQLYIITDQKRVNDNNLIVLGRVKREEIYVSAGRRLHVNEYGASR